MNSSINLPSPTPADQRDARWRLNAAQIHDGLTLNASRYDDGRITWEQWTARNIALWDRATEIGVASQVNDIIWKRSAA